MNYQAFLKYTIGYWLIISIIVLPFPFAIFPQFNYAFSDSIVHYKVVGAAVLPALIIAGISYYKKNNFNIDQHLHVIINYILIFFLLKYGFDKIFKNQFYFPEPNILHTPLGSLHKDILYWSTMGTSYSYNVFMGLLEIVPAVLMVFRKTRFLGSFIAFAVLLNVWAVNFSFDITVKLFSSLLLACTIYQLWFYRKVIAAITTLNFSNNFQDALTNRTKSSLLNRLVKGTILSLFIVEIFTPFIESETLNQDNRQKPSFYGSFYIEQNEENSIIPGNTSRIHFHKDGYLITENNQQEFEDYKIDMSIGNNSFSIKATNHLFRFYEEKNTVQLKVIKNKDTCNLNLRRIKNQNLPISNDGFHLTAEQIINEQHEQNHE